MTKLLPIILIAMCFAMLSEMRSQKNLSGNGYRRKDAFFCVCMMLVLAVFVGLRTRYNDTTTYTRSYELLRVKDSIFNGIEWSLSSSVGFELTQRLIKYLGGSAQTFLMLFALFDVGVNVWFIRKYSDSLWLSFFLYIAMGCYVFNMAAIMQCTATSLILIAMDRLMRVKSGGSYYMLYWLRCFTPTQSCLFWHSSCSLRRGREKPISCWSALC